MGVPPGSSPVRRRRKSRGGRIQDRIFVFIVLKVKRFDCSSSCTDGKEPVERKSKYIRED